MALRRLMGLVVPDRCVGCGGRGSGFCLACQASLRPPPAAPPPPGLDAWYAAYEYTGAAREAVARLKYRNHRSALEALAVAAAAEVPWCHRRGLVVWIPASRARMATRGFDHGELLARRVAACLGLPVAGVLARLDSGAQTGRPGSERRRGPAFGVRSRVPPPVVVVDDVATTGATLEAAATILRVNGCNSVIGVTVARTPLKRRRAASDPGSGRDQALAPPSHQGATNDADALGLQRRPRPSIR